MWPVDDSCTDNLTYAGVLIGGGSASTEDMDMSSSRRGRRGLQIHPSSKLSIHCTLPASMVIVVPITPSLPSQSPQKVSSPDGSDGIVSGEADTPPKEPSGNIQRSKSSDSEVDVTASADALAPPSYQWIGDKSGELHELVTEFLKTLPPEATSFSICFACVDRMTRDALVLSCRTLVGFNADVGARERLCSLPWVSEDGSRRTADVQSIAGEYCMAVIVFGRYHGVCSGMMMTTRTCVAGKDLLMRLKELEDENAVLKRQQYSLNLQIMEHEEEFASHTAMGMSLARYNIYNCSSRAAFC